MDSDWFPMYLRHSGDLRSRMGLLNNVVDWGVESPVWASVEIPVENPICVFMDDQMEAWDGA